MSTTPTTGLETRILYGLIGTLLGIVLATYVLPNVRWPDLDSRIEMAVQ